MSVEPYGRIEYDVRSVDETEHNHHFVRDELRFDVVGNHQCCDQTNDAVITILANLRDI